MVDVINKPLPIPKNEPQIKRSNVSPCDVGVTCEVMPSAAGYRRWNGQLVRRKFHGRLTSSGEVYDMFEFPQPAVFANPFLRSSHQPG